MVKWSIVGLSFCVCGDISLMFKGSLAFKIGTGFFLIGHLAYNVCFWKGQPWRKFPLWAIIMGVVGSTIM